MKLSQTRVHWEHGMGALGTNSTGLSAASPNVGAQDQLSFDDVYRTYVAEVLRWLRALSVLSEDREDVAQEVFVIVQRNLPRFQGGNLAGWLYRITCRTARDHRRSAWFRRVLLLGSDRTARASVQESAEARVEAEQWVWKLLDPLSPKLKTVFVLFEIEGYEGRAIAELMDIPLKTVWTRLHLARKAFLEQKARFESAERVR